MNSLSYSGFIACNIAAMGIGALGLSIAVRYTGVMSLAYPAFMAVGAAVTMATVLVLDVPWIVAIAVSGCVTAVLGGVWGALCYTITGFHRGVLGLIVTFTAGNILRHVIGSTGVPVMVASSEVVLNVSGVLIASCIGYYWVVSGRLGRLFQTIKESRALALSQGINVMRYSALSHSISMAYAGVAGALIVGLTGYMTGSFFDVPTALLYFAIVCVGSIRTRVGPIIGSVGVGLVMFNTDQFNYLTDMVIGVMCLAIVWARPVDIANMTRRVYRRFQC